MFKLENILKKSDLDKIPADLVIAINEGISTEFKSKFDTMMESINDRFHKYVDSAITESVNTNLTEKVNQKLLNTVQTIVTVLEAAGLPVTEKSAQLAEELKIADKKLMDSFQEREEIKLKMDEANKEKFIYSRLQGLRPEIVSAAIEHFKDKDIMEVKEEIQDFVEQNFDNLIPNFGDDFSDVLSSNNMDKVQDALDEIAASNDELMYEKNNASAAKFEGSEFFDNIKGLSPMSAKGKGISPDISAEALKATEGVLMESLGDEAVAQGEFTDDAKDALDSINNFENMGYALNFKKRQKKQ